MKKYIIFGFIVGLTIGIGLIATGNFAIAGVGDVNLIAKVAPQNDGFIGMVDAEQVIAGHLGTTGEWIFGTNVSMTNASTTGYLTVGGYASTTGGLFTQGSGHYGGDLTVDSEITALISVVTPNLYIGTDTGAGLEAEIGYEPSASTGAFTWTNHLTYLYNYANQDADIFFDFFGVSDMTTYYLPDFSGTFLIATGTSQDFETTGYASTSNGLYTQGNLHIGGDVTIDGRTTTTNNLTIGQELVIQGTATSTVAGNFDITGDLKVNNIEAVNILQNNYTVTGDAEIAGWLTVGGNATTTGHFAALGGNSDQWNLAYSWGDHALAGYYAAADYTTDWESNYNSTTTLNGLTNNQANWNLAYTHIGESGASHTYIDQSVVSGASPTFTGTNISGIPAASILAGTFGSGAYVFDNTVSGITTLTAQTASTTVALNTQGTLHVGGNATIDGAMISGGALTLNGAGASAGVVFSGTAGGGGAGLQYKDAAGTARYALQFSSDEVWLSNRAVNGTVHIRANAAAGGGGEIEVAEFQDDEINFLVSGGNVGIGTATPGKTLDVMGEIRGDATVKFGDNALSDDYRGEYCELQGIDETVEHLRSYYECHFHNDGVNACDDICENRATDCAGATYVNPDMEALASAGCATADVYPKFCECNEE